MRKRRNYVCSELQTVYSDYDVHV